MYSTVFTNHYRSTKYHLQHAPTYHCVHCGVDTERCVLRWEGFTCRHDNQWVACAGAALCDVLHGGLAAQRCVVWSAGRQEVRCLVSCHHLAGIGEDGGSEQAEGIDTWGGGLGVGR